MSPFHRAFVTNRDAARTMTQPRPKLAAAIEPPTIFVVDDDVITLRVIVQTLRGAGHTVEAFEDPRAFLASAPFRRHGCAVLDMSMPELSGLAVQKALADSEGTLPVVFLTGSADVRSSVTAMKGGALDFLLKPVNPEELLSAVERAIGASARARAARAERETLQALLLGLTPREREVCELLSRGLLNKQIAYELGLSEATVKIHRAHVMEKLHVGSTAELSAIVERMRSS